MDFGRQNGNVGEFADQVLNAYTETSYYRKSKAAIRLLTLRSGKQIQENNVLNVHFVVFQHFDGLDNRIAGIWKRTTVSMFFFGRTKDDRNIATYS